jgi:1,4-alpha-glucan branching enzyme
LLQSSDWPFLVTTGQAKEYAITRFQEHVGRFQRLKENLLAGVEDPALVRELFEKDKVFPDIDYRSFRNRETGMS